MIKTFRNKELAKLWNGTKSKIDARFQDRIQRRLDRMDAAITITELDVPGFNFHPLKGKPQRYSVHINGPWCLTFEFENGDCLRIDFEQYH
jgi:proteic killer suppression protein